MLNFLNAAFETMEGTSTDRRLKVLIQEVEKRNEKDELSLSPPPISQPDIPDALIFGGKDERLSLEFFRHAIAIQAWVVRLEVPRIFGAARTGQQIIGTGWLIVPDLLCNNFRVIESRDYMRSERPATHSELRTQPHPIFCRNKKRLFTS